MTHPTTPGAEPGRASADEPEPIRLPDTDGHRAAVISCDIALGPDTLIRGLVYPQPRHAVIDLGGARLIADRNDLTRLHHTLSAAITALDEEPQPD
jgi:hypothetical protein